MHAPLQRWRWPLAVLALALALPGWWIDARMFFACWLVAWWFCLGLVMGGLTNVWLHRLTGGRWGEVLRPFVVSDARRLPWLLLLFLPLAAGLSRLYPWAVQPGGDWAQAIAQPRFIVAWFQPGFFWLRLIAYAAVWWWLARRATFARKGGAAAALALHTLVTSLASVDLLMSLVPGWFSTAFGLVVLSGQALGGTAFGIVRLARVPQVMPAREPGHPPLWRDLGNLQLMWLMTWAYVAFMEFLIIWAANLPREIAWYLPRLQTLWWGVALALVLLQFALPLLALLWRAVKDEPQRLRGVAGALLLMQLVNSAWLVLPSVAPHSLLGWWLVPWLTLAMGLMVFGEPRVPAGTVRVGEPQHANP